MSTPLSSTPSSDRSKTSASNYLQVPGAGGDQVHRIKNVPGYTTPVFKGKDEQRAKVQANVTQKVPISLIPLFLSSCLLLFSALGER